MMASSDDWILEECRDFYKEKLKSVNHLKERSRLLRFGLTQAHGLKTRFDNAQFLEFGVYEGRDIKLIASFVSFLDNRIPIKKRATTTVHGFDSFCGLPEDWKNGQSHEDGLAFKAGAFDVNGEAPADLQNVVFHKGWFDSTVGAFFEQHGQPVAFVHADADLYSSTITFLEEICKKRLLRAGSVIIFDEFWNFEHWKDGEYKAWCEIVEKYGLRFRYLGLHAPKMGSKKRTRFGYQSVCVLIQRDMS